jgi:uncharacterized protein (TIGR02117 family)
MGLDPGLRRGDDEMWPAHSNSSCCFPCSTSQPARSEARSHATGPGARQKTGSRTAEHDWSGLVRPEHIRDPRYAGRYLWFGWGERDFYLNTPTWAEVSPLTVLRAAVGSGRTLVHVDHLLEPYADGRPVRLSPAQYARLVRAIRAQFAGGQPIPGYDVADVFYLARGRYDAVRTCNWWTGELLAEAGVRVGAWTPFSATVMQWF